MGVPRIAETFLATVSALRAVWRCGVAMRVIRARHSYMSDLVRRRGELHCHRRVIRFLWNLSQVMITKGIFSPRAVFVEVGSSLGDCMLAAAALLPEGSLHGVAFEAEPLSA